MKPQDLWPFVLAVGARIVFQRLAHFTADDAYITFRYAKNLAQGLGFVYNEGERVLGTSTPLFTLLLAGLRVFQVPVPWGATVVLLLASGVTAVLLRRFAGNLGFGRFAWLPPVLYALWPRSLTGDTSGMETALFAAIVLAGFYAHHCGRPDTALLLAALAALIRPEGILLFGVLGLDHLVGARRAGHLRAGLRTLLLPLGLLAGWALYAWVTFGSPVSNAIPAKLALFERFLHESYYRSLVWMLAWHNPVGWVHTGAAVIGATWLLRRRRFGIPEITWLVAMVLFFSFSRTHLFFWYAVPLYPVYLLLGAATLPALAEWWPRLERGLAQAVLALVIVPTLLLGARQQALHYRMEQEDMDDVHKAIGFYLADHVRPGDLVAAEDIGYMGYFSGCRILDRDGLVSPAAVPYNRAGNYLGLVLDAAPQWVVVSREGPTSRFVSDPAFLSAYVLERTFTHVGASAYAVFRRRH